MQAARWERGMPFTFWLMLFVLFNAEPRPSSEYKKNWKLIQSIRNI